MPPSTSPTGRSRLRRGLAELALLAVLYVAYSVSRHFADDAMGPALSRAQELLNVERLVGLHWEFALNQLFVEIRLVGLLSSFWYATAHYVVTAGALVWLFRKGPRRYVPERRALVAATTVGLALYLMLPMAPPRFVDGYVDVLALHATEGWWGSDASAPQGLGELTNQLAAFPSLHAGWALWVAIIVQRHSSSRWAHGLAWAHAAITAVVIVGTGNHWVLDVLAGWAVIGVGFAVARWMTPRMTRTRHAHEHPAPVG
ncbi:phosphatase PAP2 family protein [Nocardioides sp. SYSU DS0663]|uniref:phosphatase PAP2 family protein n=1 Tax=Nocardioides sp. SYSU DS0663 TaxID=3416445 RepID=UPI003F4C0E19